jgi:hypothetical protein
MDKSNQYLEELQMVTGVFSDNINYLMAILLSKEVEQEKKNSVEVVECETGINIEQSENLDDWFNSFGDEDL